MVNVNSLMIPGRSQGVKGFPLEKVMVPFGQRISLVGSLTGETPSRACGCLLSVMRRGIRDSRQSSQILPEVQA